ncbi:MAG: hypothetical protein D6698_10980 [Gammaproteobacteria bacterium]|nr:MAG: hypothetical protein D6698_10980 [Gammaproteobacteria bacterium]
MAQPAHTLTEVQKKTVITATRKQLQCAADLYETGFTEPPILFDLGGTQAGACRIHKTLLHTHCSLHYNSAVFSLDLEHHLHDTVIHEVAHYIAFCLHGPHIKPHGPEWKQVVKQLGGTPKARGDYCIEGLKIRRQRRFPYTCGCRTLELSATLHNRIQNGQVRICRFCGKAIAPLIK